MTLSKYVVGTKIMKVEFEDGCGWYEYTQRVYMAGRCRRTAQSTTRCRIITPRRRHRPINANVLQRVISAKTGSYFLQKD